MSYAIKNWLEVYARLRETFLRSHPERRLIPEYSEDSPPSVERERDPIITWTPDFKEKLGSAKWAVAVLAVIVLLSGDS